MRGCACSGIAIVHDYLIQMGGAERVVATMARAFPDSPIYTSVTSMEELLDEFKSRDIRNSWLQFFPFSSKRFKQLFPIYPLAFRLLNLPKVEVVWISASTFSKCVRVKPRSTTFCYCHNSTRFIWDGGDYIKTEINVPFVRMMVRMLLPLLRRVDYQAAQRMTFLIANSENVRSRLEKDYKRSSVVIHPPVNVENYDVCFGDQGYDVVVSRLVAYKRIDLAVRAYSELGKTLHIVGDGTDRQRLEAMAGPSVRFLGRVSEDQLKQQIASARALVFPGEEDFGIAPVEAQACGKPVIAYHAGGALETVEEGVTGVFFNAESPESLRDAIFRSERVSWDPVRIRKNAERFSEAEFLRKMIGYMNARLQRPLDFPLMDEPVSLSSSVRI